MLLKIQTPQNLLNEYDILINNDFRSDLIKLIKEYEKVLLVTDSNISLNFYKDILKENVFVKVINPGENSKTIEVYMDLLKVMIENSFSRKSLVIAFGGGVVGDLSGFLASSYKRGVDFALVPTSTLSMVDSCIGGKTAINFGSCKNVIGFFAPIKKVYINPLFLETLDEENYFNGFIEAFKYGLIGDYELIKIFMKCDKNSIASRQDEIITRSLMVKKKFIEKDYFDKNERKFLNFGHTLGHAIELKYNILHGYAVGIGMLAFANKDVQGEIYNTLCKLYDIKKYLNRLKVNDKDIKHLFANDKKYQDGFIDIVYLESYEKLVLKKLSVDEVMEAYNEICNWK